jgi:hypothetical protein
MGLHGCSLAQDKPEMSVERVPSVEDLRQMISKIEHAADLPPSVRSQASALQSEIEATPALVAERLAELWQGYYESSSYADPEGDLLRCVSIGAVQRHMTDDRWRPLDPLTFERMVIDSGDPAAFLRSTIPPGQEIFPPKRSWLIDADGLATMSGNQIHEALELGPNNLPPYVIFRLSASRMIQAGVQVRVPTALDAAAGQQPQWTPAGLAIGQEYVDRSVPIEAVEEVIWRP